MKIRAVKKDMLLEFPSGDSMVVGTDPIEVPAPFESDVRRALAHSFGIVEVDKPPRVVKEKKPAEPKPSPANQQSPVTEKAEA